MVALLPPKLRESTFRRARLGQWVDGTDEPWLPPGLWDARATGASIPDGTEVVVGLDGSFSQDGTALVVVTIAEHPHVDVVDSLGSRRRRSRLPGAGPRRGGRHPPGVPPLARPGDRRRPVPLDPQPPAPRRRAPARRRVPPVARPDDSG